MSIIGKAIKGSIIINEKLRRREVSRGAQRTTLLKLLKKAQKTDFGRMYGFSEILMSANPEEKFREKVPVFDYDSMHNEWWKFTRLGAENVCWPGKIKYFALSSGTSGSPSKYIPVSTDMIDYIRKVGFKHLSTVKDHPVDKDIYGKDILLLGGSPELQKKDHTFSGDLSGILTANLPLWLNFIYKPGYEISKESDWNVKIDRIVKEAHKWDVGIISGVPSWAKLLIEKIIDHYGLKNIHELWPGLSVFSHGGVSLKPYREGLDKLMGKEIVYLETYLASEGFIAYERKGNQGMKLVPGNGIYYEFIPFDDEHFNTEGKLISSEGIVNYEGVEDGKEYALLISTCSGAWRYLIGDTVKFRGEQLFITGRTKHFLSVCGEHLSVDNMNDGIRELSSTIGVDINEYTVVALPYDRGFAHKWYLGVEDEEIDPALCQLILDEKLKALNDDYRTERNSVLKQVKVIPVPIRYFYQWMQAEHKIGGQAKFPRVLNEKHLRSWEMHLASKGIDTAI